ncbi:O-methyltransferase [Pontibacter sp. SGAir0037]|uniref:O-methyltransferase n=1 Tax=Pontibacter sp. SGAir0037 TaxID=2571030 RepID=UPI0010CD3862|nr:class I SAM-dependent methyltransferase [Pontibacter sp. SGAir0037]QCR22734.1 SAM-dependent methyltransferase [Pontibacter sp. SGAir0037]
MLPFRFAADYLQYRLRSIKLHGVHSPFIFNLYNNVIRHKGNYYAYLRVEALRDKLLHDHRTLQVTDFGAGPKSGKKLARKVKRIAASSAKPAKYSQLLFRLANHFKPRTVFDLGTSLGITSSYLAEAAKNSCFYTFEGCPAVARVARENFKNLGLKHVQLVEGNLDDTLEQQLQQVEQLDFVFFDGNHRYEPTMRYFNACLTKAHECSVFVVDDLYWSAEMKKAWNDIKKHPQVLQTVDLFFIGLVFFRTSQPKEHFTLLY